METRVDASLSSLIFLLLDLLFELPIPNDIPSTIRTNSTTVEWNVDQISGINRDSDGVCSWLITRAFVTLWAEQHPRLDNLFSCAPVAKIRLSDVVALVLRKVT